MPDPNMMSVHLEGTPRLADFRVARHILEGRCGDATLGGDVAAFLKPEEPGDGVTIMLLGKAPTFFIQDGDHVHPLKLGINSVGRLPDNSVIIRDECVSRRHCAIVVHKDGTCELHDVASKNGTVLNGSRIAYPTRIAPGDTITLCSRSIKFLRQSDG